MSDVRHYFSKPAKGAFFAMTLLASGCATSGINMLSFNQPASKPQTETKLASSQSTSKSDASRPGKTQVQEGISTSEAYPGQQPSPDRNRNSAWCRYLDANARAQGAILRSPTISGDINDGGNGGVSVSYDFVDLARARLKEETAEAQCRRFLVSNKLARMMIIAPQSLTLAGNRARADYLKSKRNELNSIKRKIKRHITNGEMTVQLGTALIQHAETVASVEHRARAEVLRRQAIGKLERGSTLGLDSELENSERVLQAIGRRSRSLEAVKVSISAGYGYQGDSGIRSNSGYGKIKLSYRLGAINPVRQEYEDIAAKARVEALYEENRGVLWRSNEMSQAVSRARAGLVAQRKQLKSAIAEARSNMALYVKGYEIEMLQPRYRGQIDAIALQAELLGINATLIDMARVERSLRFK